MVTDDQLRDLVESWREERDDRDPNTLSNVATLSKVECARELEALIEDE
jgi:hypothetical protein